MLLLPSAWALVSNPNILAECKITHIVSILHDQASADPHHLTIALGDSSFENLPIHLPRICDFIDEAVAGGGVVFVHCEMGISRSPSCVIAYGEQRTPSFRDARVVMRRTLTELPDSDEKEWPETVTGHSVCSGKAVLYYVWIFLLGLARKSERNVIRPNEGFIRQLYVFEQCDYAATETHPAYIAWKKANEEAVVADAHAVFMHFRPIDYNSNYIRIARYIGPNSPPVQ